MDHGAQVHKDGLQLHVGVSRQGAGVPPLASFSDGHGGRINVFRTGGGEVKSYSLIRLLPWLTTSAGKDSPSLVAVRI